jgi:hypothetical protein
MELMNPVEGFDNDANALASHNPYEDIESNYIIRRQLVLVNLILFRTPMIILYIGS